MVVVVVVIVVVVVLVVIAVVVVIVVVVIVVVVVVIVVVVVVVIVVVVVVVIVVCSSSSSSKSSKSSHECEIFSSREHERAESHHNYKNCKKNPGHENFISAQDFEDNYLPRLQSDIQREKLRSRIDLTVRLRVGCTSSERPDDDDMAKFRGTDKSRLGTGFVYAVKAKYNKPCFCPNCNGQVARKQWSCTIWTANHVVYNTEEAKETKIDFFYNDNSCRRDGRMKSVSGMAVVKSEPDKDFCWMSSVTCDEDLGERIGELDWQCGELNRQDITELGLPLSGDNSCDLILIVSHPHGQPKKVTVGEVRCRDGVKGRLEYNTPTCPGSSGAPVFGYDRSQFFIWSPVHTGSFGKTSTENTHKLNEFQRVFKKMKGHKTEQEQINYCFVSF
ncbi:hypothetical protein ElyMa_006940800 [Elysia marginata]|uniref:Peptidase S1 domain-containing protein n=1 Tax=Elysia marginata TaxID=1093978 RepID=A0AAV4JI44_9GAST|nr:hypothetical protein ElyMa_006940800 [Elysia marginata]